MVRTLDELLQRATSVRDKHLVVAFPGNIETLDAVRLASERFSLKTVLVGDEQRIAAALPKGSALPQGVRVIHQSDVLSALHTCMELLKDQPGGILLKGSVDTGTLLRAVLDETSGLRTGNLLSDVFVVEYAEKADRRLVMITDGGVTLAPDLKAKADLIRNAVAVAHALGNDRPKVAVLSATEFVNPSLPSTLDAAALSKMNQRGQLSGCIVDGPLGLDNALSPEAAQEKGITSEVAGYADILLAPSIEAANLLAKATTYFAHMRLAHVIVGARVPVLIPSRADTADAKLLSIALGMLVG
jgi:phosphate butyryltransferase